MLVYYAADVRHAAVAQLYSISIKYLIECGMFGELSVQDVEELFPNISLYALAIWWVKPRDVSLSCLVDVFVGLPVVIQFVVVITAFQGSFVHWLCIFKVYLA